MSVFEGDNGIALCTFAVIGVLGSICAFFIPLYKKNDEFKRKERKSRRARTETAITSVFWNFAFLILYCFIIITNWFGEFVEILGSVIIISSWWVAGAFIKQIDEEGVVTEEEKNVGYLVSVFTAGVVSIVLEKLNPGKGFIRIASISLSVFLGAYIPISLYSRSIPLSIDGIRRWSRRFRFTVLNTVVCSATSISIILFVYYSMSYDAVATAFLGLGVGLSLGALVIVSTISIVEHVKQRRN